MVRQFIVAFVALFIAMDVVGVLPIYLGLVTGLGEIERRRIVIEATVTAAAVGVGFLLVGDLLLGLLGVTVADFQIAGGILLLVLSVYDLLHPATPLRQLGTNMSVVPLGIPMIVGPAVLTTLLLLARIQGYVITLFAFSANLLLVWTALRWAHKIEGAIGEAGARAVAKVASLLLAAIAVTMIRMGVEDALSRYWHAPANKTSL
jgi:multiple antibiotic resistance protein